VCQGRIKGGGFGDQNPLLGNIFFSIFKGFLKKKPQTPLNFPVHTIKPLIQKISGYAPTVCF